MGNKLPSNQQVLQLFLFNHENLKKTIRDSAKVTFLEVKSFWIRARIPIRREQKCIEKIMTLHKKWTALKKNFKRKSSKTQCDNERLFQNSLEDLFDIAHGHALKLIKIEEDRRFLKAQREKGRRGSLAGIDQALAASEKKRLIQEVKEKDRAMKEFKRKQETGTVVFPSSDSEFDGDEAGEEDHKDNDKDNDIIFKATSKCCEPPKKKRKSAITGTLSMALDRCNVSDRKATFILAESAKALCKDAEQLVLSRSTVRRRRQDVREKEAQKSKQSCLKQTCLTVHWDGKLMKDYQNKNMVDRLPIFITGYQTNKLLAVPKLEKGTGDAQASAVLKALKEWDVADTIVGMCFDTTATNTGRKNGACILLEKHLQKNLLNLACRHHVLEIILRAAFEACFGGSKAPDVILFKKFEEKWRHINHAKFQCGIYDDEIRESLQDCMQDMVSFAQVQLKEQQPRDDYREFLKLIIIFLGHVPPDGIRFLSPGGVSQARWMSKGIYALKIWMFRSQFKLSSEEELGLRKICIFLVKVYFKAWFTAPLTIAAPRNDLQLLKAIISYKCISDEVSQAALKKMLNHLWYLGEHLVALAFFDPSVAIESKRLMVHALNTRVGNPQGVKKFRIDLDEAEICLGQNLDSFVTRNTLDFFQILHISTAFLQSDPSEWDQNDGYLSAVKVVKSLSVTNDVAERGVALMKEYNSTLTTDEVQKQYLLQVVEKHRKDYPVCSKSAILGEQT